MLCSRLKCKFQVIMYTLLSTSSIKNSWIKSLIPVAKMFSIQIFAPGSTANLIDLVTYPSSTLFSLVMYLSSLPDLATMCLEKTQALYVYCLRLYRRSKAYSLLLPSSICL